MVQTTLDSAHVQAVPARPRRVYRPLHGVLLLDKPIGLSSNDALQRVRRLLRAEKGGHTGTLDLLATGLLPLCFGAATKFAQASLDADKAYRATVALGTTMTTGDLEGEPVLRRPVPSLDRAAVQSACDAFLGEIDQVPPMHSALKHQGRALYDYARAGQEVERSARRVRIDAIEVVGPAPEAECGGTPHRWVVDVRCSKGTYIRTLAEAIGERLGCGAHLAALRRTASGPLVLAHAVTLPALEAMDEPAREALLLPPEVLLADRPAVVLDGAEAARFLTGLRRRVTCADHPFVRVHGPEPGAFLGSAHVKAGELIADRLLSPEEVRGLLLQHAPRSPADR